MVPPAASAPIEDWSDADIAARYDDPARAALDALRDGKRAGATRFVFVLPPETNAASEAVRLLALSAARQWEAEGVTVNCVVGDNTDAIAFLASGAMTGKTL